MIFKISNQCYLLNTILTNRGVPPKIGKSIKLQTKYIIIMSKHTKNNKKRRNLVDDDTIEQWEKQSQTMDELESQASLDTELQIHSHKYRRLRKKIHEDNVCIICLGSLSSNFAELKQCSHSFCYDCILNWAKQVNTCPICRKPFKLLNRANEQLVKLFFYHENACIVCKKCQPEEQLVPCYVCEKKFSHRGCNRQTIRQDGGIPLWKCKKCLSEESQSSQQSNASSQQSQQLSQYIIGDQ